MFKNGDIKDVMIKELIRFTDSRGWLTELFRHDEMVQDIYPVMSYLSLTYPGVVRGPHAHKEQTDNFVFTGPSIFKVFMWDSREKSSTYLNKMVVFAGGDRPLIVVIPPGIIHAYKNIGTDEGTVINFPNRLFRGVGKKYPVDEIRYEDDPNSIYKTDE